MGAQVITTVQTPASSYDLTTLESVKLDLNISDGDTTNDTFLSAKISQVSTAVQSYCNRPFVSETYQDVFYPDRGIEPFWSIGRFNVLQLSRWPVTSITSIVVQVDNNSGDDVTLTAGTDYQMNGLPGQVVRLNCLTGRQTKWQPLPTTVIYVAGYATIPLDLVGAVNEMVTSRFWSRARDPSIKRINQARGVGEQEFWIPNTPAGAFPPSVADILDKYRPPVTA